MTFCLSCIWIVNVATRVCVNTLATYPIAVKMLYLYDGNIVTFLNLLDTED